MHYELVTAFISTEALRGLLVEVPERTVALARSGTSITAIMLSVFLLIVIMLFDVIVIILRVILPSIVLISVILKLRCHDTRHNDSHKIENQHKGLICDTQNKNTLSFC
jgi:hypothetical protein